MTLLILGDNATAKAIQAALPAPVFLFNPLEIIPLNFNPALKNLPHKVIVISVAAAEFGFQKIATQLKPTTELFAIGKTTADHLQLTWPKTIIYPTPFNSEALLALPQLQHVSQQKILLIKGEEGRTLIKKTLSVRGALLETLECYQRQPKHIDLTESLKIWQNSGVNTLLVTSAASLAAFCALVPNKTWLLDLTLIVTSERLEKIARGKGFQYIQRAKNFTVEEILKCIHLSPCGRGRPGEAWTGEG